MKSILTHEHPYVPGIQLARVHSSETDNWNTYAAAAGDSRSTKRRHGGRRIGRGCTRGTTCVCPISHQCRAKQPGGPRAPCLLFLKSSPSRFDLCASLRVASLFFFGCKKQHIEAHSPGFRLICCNFITIVGPPPKKCVIVLYTKHALQVKSHFLYSLGSKFAP